jgi:Putative DNA-binding domain
LANWKRDLQTTLNTRPEEANNIMLKPVPEWDESYIVSLPKENSELERKGSKKLDLTVSGVDENDVLNELAKQLSAFANTGGGKIIYGIRDDGTTDGGVSTAIKKGGTKEWLERQLPGLTEYEIVGANVFEVGPSNSQSQILTGKALYIVDVPDSDRAPHQSRRDWKYYIRLGSQSQPAPHKLIEDIRNRQKYPRLDCEIALERFDTERSPHNTYEVKLRLRIILFPIVALSNPLIPSCFSIPTREHLTLSLTQKSLRLFMALKADVVSGR